MAGHQAAIGPQQQSIIWVGWIMEFLEHGKGIHSKSLLWPLSLRLATIMIDGLLVSPKRHCVPLVTYKMLRVIQVATY